MRKGGKRVGQDKSFVQITKHKKLQGSGCGSVGRAVASDTRGQWFKAIHGQTFIQNICLLSTVLKRQK